MTSNLTIGFIGLGNIGLPMAKRLLTTTKCNMRVCDKIPSQAAIMEGIGATVCSNPEETCQGADYVILMVLNEAQLDTILFGEGGLWKTISGSSTIINAVTCGPDYNQLLVRRAKAEKPGLGILGAPVSGAAMRAENGTLSFYVGGEKELVDKAMPIFEAMGSKILYINEDAGSGSAVKLGNNLVLSGSLFLVRSALDLAESSGISEETMLEAMSQGTSDCFLIRNWGAMRDQTLAEKSPLDLKLAYKDVDLALKCFRKKEILSPIAGITAQMDVTKVFPK